MIVPRCMKGQRMSEGDLRSSPVTKEEESSEQQIFFFLEIPGEAKSAMPARFDRFDSPREKRLFFFVGTAEQSNSPKELYKGPLLQTF